LEVPETVDGDGNFLPHVPLFAGKNVFDANDDIADKLAEASGLLARGEVMHTYPHSWRSKAPLIFRNTPQWFISMETNELRRKALAAIDRVRWVPPSARNRIYGMVEERPDWVVSRQRAWGVPLPVFVDRKTGEILRDPAVLERVAAAVAADGADVWFVSEPKRFLGSDYDGRAYEKVEDILDVWFESGSTHSFVLETRPDLEWPASLYLEGSDQHRGWFHSSLLEACGTRGEAPYEAVLTHGFVVDAEGRKMSKSLGNVIAPQEVMDEYGADILRIWAVSADYAEDLRISKEILDYQADGYRRLRNTYRYLLANLAGFKPEERLAHEEMPPLERWVLHRLVELDALVRRSCEAFDFHPLFTALHNFCAVDLSAFYFDVRKDSLYCDRPDSARRRAARTVMDALFSCLTAWLAPIICFTTEEAWLHRYPDEEGSVHLRLFPELPGRWRDDALADNWEKARRLRRVVTGALEVERREKRIGSSLDAHPTVYAPGEHVAAMDGVALAEIAITSAATLMEGEPPSEAFTLDEVPGVGVVAGLAEGRKCDRCWQVLTEVGSLPAHADLCRRCADAVDALAAGSAT
ncbi:MAG: isoleucine--tRNA ligase, partial [Alphaproteobacteria bacterium]